MQRDERHHNQCTARNIPNAFLVPASDEKRKEKKKNRIIFGETSCCRCRCASFALACCLDKGVSSGKSPDVVCRGKQAKELVESFLKIKVDRCHADVNKYDDYYTTTPHLWICCVFGGRHDRKCSCQTRARRLFLFFLTQLLSFNL